MTHGSLFSGIGGFDLAADWINWENLFNCEKDVFCRRLLRHYWPQTKSYENVREFKGNEYRGILDVLSGGFPCQPFSQAGKRKGTADERYLWPQMLRIVREILPGWVVGENVSGLVNWEGGLVFRKVLTGLEMEGYDVWPYVLPAGGIGAYHRRDRIFFVACRKDRFPHRSPGQRGNKEIAGKAENGNEFEKLFGTEESTDSDGNQRSKRRMYPTESETAKRHPGAFDAWNNRYPWENFPLESPLCGGNDGLPVKLDRITFSSWRKESLKAYGNAIVPQIAWQIFQSIERVEMNAKLYKNK